MRLWRKLYGSILTSQKASQVTDSALLLWHFIVVSQDDNGRVPYEKAFLRSLSSSRDWSWEEIEQFLAELTKSGLVHIHDAFVYLYKGEEFNGKPTDAKMFLTYPDPNQPTIPTYMKGVNAPMLQAIFERDNGSCRQCGSTRSLTLDHLVPRVAGGKDTIENLRLLCRPCNSSKGQRLPALDSRDEPVSTTTQAPIDHDTPNASTRLDLDRDGLRVEKSRVEESRKENTPLWTPPEWFIPLTKLSGYKIKNHERAAKGIEAACIESGVSVVNVVAGFAEDWPSLKIQYRWHDPVATLKGTPLSIAIKKTKNGGDNGKPGRRLERDAGRKVYVPKRDAAGHVILGH